MEIQWRDPKKELPPEGKQIEVLVRGYSEWINGRYYVALWQGVGPNQNFAGTGTWPTDGIFNIEAWAYIE